MVTIRPADTGDLEAITDLTNALIDQTTYEWTEARHNVDERAAWLDDHRAAGHPVFVAVDDDEVVGWAAYTDFRDTSRWPGYRTTVELTIHVAEHTWGRGIGRRLIGALADEARAAGKRVLVAGIDGSNEDSIRFHDRLGFEVVARMPGVGLKWGLPIDLVLMQLDLVPDGDPRWDQAVELLVERDAPAFDHPGGDLHSHLQRTAGQLRDWGSSEALTLAGLCHAMYGTDGLPVALMGLDERDALREVIGDEAETIVHRYCSCLRSPTYAALERGDQSFSDRFTGESYPLGDEELADFVDLTIANELDIARHGSLDDATVTAIDDFVRQLARWARPPARRAVENRAPRVQP